LAGAQSVRPAVAVDNDSCGRRVPGAAQIGYNKGRFDLPRDDR